MNLLNIFFYIFLFLISREDPVIFYTFDGGMDNGTYWSKYQDIKIIEFQNIETLFSYRK